MRNRISHSLWRVLLAACLAAPTACNGENENGYQDESTFAAIASSERADSPSTGTILLRADTTDPAAQPARPAYTPEEPFTQRRERMVQSQIADREVQDPKVLDAMRRVPRHRFVPDRLVEAAYEDGPLPIGHGQTISQPYIVGYMTELLELEPADRVLEVGTGSGYQAAILAELCREVVTIEIIEDLARSAAQRLQQLGYNNITAIHGDGYFGWHSRAPYDAIIVTAAAEHIPPPLIAQLKPGARMAIPVGRTGWTQNLLLVEKTNEGQVKTHNLLPVRFVPLTRGEP
jgi:protein-L-isoaspartate(D-aspartate) O-methyltransferase